MRPRLSCLLAVAALASATDVGATDASSAPSGPWIVYATRPHPPRDARFCALRAPVCVHAAKPADDAAALATASAFERAWQTLTGALALAPPDLDPDTLAYDVFLTDASDPALAADVATTPIEARDVRSRIDRARAFTVVDARVRPGCELDALAARSIARAMLDRAAPATDDATARAQTSYVAQLAVPCATALFADDAIAFQSQPNRAIADGHADRGVHAPDDPPERPSAAANLYADGGWLVWSRLEWGFSRAPGGLVAATWALAPTTTPASAVRWVHEPDTYDVLRESFKGRLSTGSTLADVWLDLAVARAFMGAADDGEHAPETRSLGDAARVPIDWDLPWPAAPKRVAPRAPVQPSGASYLVVRHAGAAPNARLRVEITWEEHALFRWALVKLDERGRELGRVVIPTKERATEAQMTLVDLDGVDRVLIVGANVGDPAYGFDPDDVVWEPHGFLVTLAAESERH